MSEHLGVRDRGPDVVLEEPTVKGDRLGELFHATVCLPPNRPPQAFLDTPHRSLKKLLCIKLRHNND